MDDILKTKLLEFDKSAFLIDLVRHKNGQLYVAVTQTISKGQKYHQAIKINPSVLPELIETLKKFQQEIDYKPPKQPDHFSGADKEKIRERYLKGVPIKDLALQFDKPENLIEQVLRNMEIEIVSGILPGKRRRKRAH